MVLLNVRYKPSKSRAKALGRQSAPKNRRPTDKVCFGYEALSPPDKDNRLSPTAGPIRPNRPRFAPSTRRCPYPAKFPRPAPTNRIVLLSPLKSRCTSVFRVSRQPKKQSRVAWASRGFSSSVVSATVVNDK